MGGASHNRHHPPWRFSWFGRHRRSPPLISFNPAITSSESVLGGKPLKTNLIFWSGLGLNVNNFTSLSLRNTRMLWWSDFVPGLISNPPVVYSKVARPLCCVDVLNLGHYWWHLPDFRSRWWFLLGPAWRVSLHKVPYWFFTFTGLA